MSSRTGDNEAVPAISATTVGGNQRIVISVCVIGRNEASHLQHCGQSLQLLATLGHRFETIYIDSSSTDGSAELARELFDTVIELESSPHLNASAGRHIATTVARGDWIVYLDGDMTLRAEFMPVLATLVASRALEQGALGRCLHVYPDATTRPMTIRGNTDGEACAAFGGAVVLPRKLVLKAGNWDPRLYSNEEAELHGRLRSAGCTVLYRDFPFVDHHTSRIPKWRMLVGSLWPARSVLGKKFYGLGQVIRARWRGGTLLPFLRSRPEPFLFLGGIVLSAAFLAAASWIAGGALLVASLVVAVRSGGPMGPVLYLTWIPQILFGLFRFPKDFVPKILRDSRRDGSTTRATS